MNTPTKSKKKVYFPNLDGLRFIAALLVIIHHIEMSKKEMGLSHVFGSSVFGEYQIGTLESFVHVIGKLGVVLFFSLSGFLITYLLIIEKERTNTVAIGKFYLRRVLRIWPLYFLIVIFALFIAPHIDFLSIPEYPIEQVQSHLWIKAFLFLFFLPNLVLVGLGIIPFAGQTWSIGTEEQFYLIWPWIVSRSKNILKLLITIIVVYVLVLGLLSSNLSEHAYYHLAKRFWNAFNIDIMAIGGIAAVMVYNKAPILKVLFTKQVQYINLAVIALLIAFGVHFPFLHFEIYGVLFTLMIMNLASNPDSVLNLEHKSLKYAGKISYGLYMYHSLVILVVLKTLQKFDMYSDYLLYPLSVIFSVIIATLSYEFFEKQFLKLKKKFVVVDSGAKV